MLRILLNFYVILEAIGRLIRSKRFNNNCAHKIVTAFELRQICFTLNNGNIQRWNDLYFFRCDVVVVHFTIIECALISFDIDRRRSLHDNKVVKRRMQNVHSGNSIGNTIFVPYFIRCA